MTFCNVFRWNKLSSITTLTDGCTGPFNCRISIAPRIQQNCEMGQILPLDWRRRLVIISSLHEIIVSRTNAKSVASINANYVQFVSLRINVSLQFNVTAICRPRCPCSITQSSRKCDCKLNVWNKDDCDMWRSVPIFGSCAWFYFKAMTIFVVDDIFDVKHNFKKKFID